MALMVEGQGAAMMVGGYTRHKAHHTCPTTTLSSTIMLKSPFVRIRSLSHFYKLRKFISNAQICCCKQVTLTSYKEVFVWHFE